MRINNNLHTANGVFLAEKNKRNKVPILCLATASPVKFEETIREVLGNEVILDRPEEFRDIENREQRFVRMGRTDFEKLKEFIEKNALK